ncbi:class I SAM-dependent methyltransferase [Rhodococcus sp. X156]|uniref:class I SAM-dependent methyltransferase n=1 Tax=Rhodococcus sp. X156 TaxID=2499145 RepID=UPI000FD75C0D|nr:class I SAM-dependent methyltransferase [Rhodococcus sp. X156]
MDADAWDERYADSDLVWGAPPNRYVVEHATALPRGRALDLACGEGRNALWLATRGWDVTALDFSRVALTKAAEVAARSPRSVVSRLHWQQADVTATELRGPGEAPYDLVLVVYLHLPREQRRAVLAAACAALAPGGHLLVVAHDSTNLTDGYGGPQDPDILFIPADVAGELPADMTLVTAAQPHREVDTPDGLRMAIDAVVVARRSAQG